MSTKGLLARVFIPTAIFSLLYLLAGYIYPIPHLLLFFILAALVLMPIELGIILNASKKEYGTWSLRSAFNGQKKIPVLQILIIAFCFFGIAGLLSAFAAPVENGIVAGMRETVLSWLPAGFDWTDFEYLRSFSRPTLVLTSVVYVVFNVFLCPITEELYFRGYLTSHYQKQNWFTPILIAILFSLYHFWLPFHNIFRILAFAPVAYVSYRKKNFGISIVFHCLCNLFSTVSFIAAVFA
ncbi:CPBP family intramembrane glutamic endopeptidase [Anaerolentibacter hominis]|uniref:CPBP family intramembrane glutamic endopeptidase n=1 Tax=Anaerolentibacter hominis TaxID=3079009 RepID=UPI0031B82D98